VNDLVNSALHVEGLSVELGGARILDDISFGVDPGTTLAIIGASGCGKTTLLKTLAGLIEPISGRIRLGAAQVEHVPPHRRGIVYLNQEPLLFPHLDVFENVAFGLRMQHLPEAQVRARVTHMLVQLELDGLEQRSPHALSGGQRQRAAFGRALIIEPALLLLDEPFSSLDPATRRAMQALFRRIASGLNSTALFVTHDLRETLTMGDQVAMMRAGRLHTYADREAFCLDPATGVMREATFWQDLAVGATRDARHDTDTAGS
jgi:ABC-type Fe3+/spermidine/putrescine transport system ATPase subunit